MSEIVASVGSARRNRLRWINIFFILLSIGGMYFFDQKNQPEARAEIDYTVKSAHPRIWLTPERISRLKQSAAENSPRWQAVKSRADEGLTTSNDSYDFIQPLGLAYQITGNKAYCTKAITLMLHQAVPSNTLSDGSYYPYRSVLPPVTSGYDWCYDTMTTTQRQQIATWLMDRADAVWPETNPARIGGWGFVPSNNYFYGFWKTLPAALAVYGDEQRAQKHIDLGLKKYEDDVRPWMLGWGKGGIFAEGTNYDSTAPIGFILDSFFTATGQDLINDTPYLDESLMWRIHSTMPSLDHQYILGDQARVSDGPLFDYDRNRAHVPALMSNNPELRQFAKHWLDTIDPDISRYEYTVAWEFIYYDGSVTALDYTKSLPLSYFASGPGIFLDRTSWDKNATYWGIWAGPLAESHQDLNVNGFLIAKNKWLAGNSTMWSHSGILGETQHHNNLTFGGIGQTWQEPDSEWPDQAGKTLKQERGNNYSYFAGWGAQAYTQDRSHGGIKTVNDYVRKMIRLGENGFIVFDRVSLVNPNLPKEWHIHSLKRPTINSQGFNFSESPYRLFGQSLLPQSGVNVATRQVDDGGLISYDTTVTTTNNAPTDFLLNVLNVSPEAATSPTASRLMSEASGGVTGLEYEGEGNWAVVLGKSELETGEIHYRTSKVLANHLVTDLKPLMNYRLKIGNVITERQETVTTNANGTARFNVLAGETDITLIPTGTSASPSPSAEPLPSPSASSSPNPTPFVPTPTPSPSTSPISDLPIPPTPTATPTITSTPKPTPSPDLPPNNEKTALVTLTKTANKSSVLAGDVVTYTLKYKNESDTPATNVKIVDTVSSFLSYRSRSATAEGKYNSRSKTLTWNIGMLAPHTEGVVTFQVRVKLRGSTIDNKATVFFCSLGDGASRCAPAKNRFSGNEASNTITLKRAPIPNPITLFFEQFR